MQSCECWIGGHFNLARGTKQSISVLVYIVVPFMDYCYIYVCVCACVYIYTINYNISIDIKWKILIFIYLLTNLLNSFIYYSLGQLLPNSFDFYSYLNLVCSPTDSFILVFFFSSLFFVYLVSSFIFFPLYFFSSTWFLSLSLHASQSL